MGDVDNGAAADDDEPAVGMVDSSGATALAPVLDMVEVSGSVRVTVFGELSVPFPTQPVQSFSTVVMAMVGVWIAVAPGRVQPQWVVVRIVVLVV